MTVTLTLDLPTALAERLTQDADARAQAGAALVRAFGANTAEDPLRALAMAQASATRELFTRWTDEEATNDDAELSRNDDDADELRTGLNHNRIATGERPHLPFDEIPEPIGLPTRRDLLTQERRRREAETASPARTNGAMINGKTRNGVSHPTSTLPEDCVSPDKEPVVR